MKLKKIKKGLVLSLVTSIIMIVGCGRNVSITSEQTEIENNAIAGIIDYETSEYGIDSNSKDFLEQLVNDSFYVVHEGIYYPLYTYYKNEEAASKNYSSVDPNRMVFYTLENYSGIPTLFPGDHLVYYSTKMMLDTITWERFNPLGITFGMFNLQRSTGGRYYLDFSDDDAETVIPEGTLATLYDLGVDYVTIDKIGGVVVNDEVVSNGLIVGATEGKNYDIEIYTGTYYKHYSAVADTFAFQAYELFMSTGTQTLQDCFWEVDIPEYFVNGYYDINGQGMVRIMRDISYSNETDFSERLLFFDEKENAYGSELTPRIYSEVAELNDFSQTQYPDALGYVDPDGDKSIEEAEKLAMLPEAAKFKEANIKTYELWFPEGRQCAIEIESKSGETTGSAVVEFDTGGTTAVTYNRFDKIYSSVINGKGNKGVLTISGFWYDYEISLINAEIYNGQDLVTEAVDSSITSEDTSSNAEENEISLDESSLLDAASENGEE